MGKIRIPQGANGVMTILALDGFESYIVGGCVRDSLLGLEPHDWDICTNATPQEVLKVFAKRGVKTIETGIKHGTVTIFMNGVGYEVTTYRMDGTYSDGRRPDNVSFTSSLQADRSRRDFTMNAMAYAEVPGLIDPFGGEKALRDKVVSCVGRPDDRLGEDALRILRALRFASTYGFRIDSDTDAAIHRLAPTLCRVSPERFNAELCRLLRGPGVLDVLLDYSDVITAVIPELAPCVGFAQNNPYHQYDVYGHIAHAVANYEGDDISVKVALLLHDIGKPQCYTEDARGGHFHGHGAVSRDLADVVTKRLRFDNKTRNEVSELVLYHDAVIEPTPKTVRRWLNKIGEERFRQLLCVRMADIRAHTASTQTTRIARCSALSALVEDVVAKDQCFSLKDMALCGKDILALGVPEGIRVGLILNALLDEVISGKLPNDHDSLTERARSML